MSNVVVQTWPVVSTRVVEVEVPGIQGPKGDTGDLTPEAKKVRKEILQAQIAAEEASQKALGAADDAEDSADAAHQSYLDTLEAKSEALAAIQEAGQTQIGLVSDKGEEQVAAVESEYNTAITNIQIEAGKQIERIQEEGIKQNQGDYVLKTEMNQALAGKADVGHGHQISDVTGLQTALDSKQPTGDYATNSALTAGLAQKAEASHTHPTSDITGLDDTLDAVLEEKADLEHTHSHEDITDWSEATVNFWSTANSTTGAIPDSGSMGWSTIWQGAYGGETTTTGLLVSVDGGDPQLTIQAKRGQQYGQIVLSKSDIKLQTGQGKELSVNTLMTMVSELGETYAPISHSHTITDLPKASQAEAEAGTDDTKVMTPLATAAAITEQARLILRRW